MQIVGTPFTDCVISYSFNKDFNFRQSLNAPSYPHQPAICAASFRYINLTLNYYFCFCMVEGQRSMWANLVFMILYIITRNQSFGLLNITICLSVNYSLIRCRIMYVISKTLLDYKKQGPPLLSSIWACPPCMCQTLSTKINPIS